MEKAQSSGHVRARRPDECRMNMMRKVPFLPLVGIPLMMLSEAPAARADNSARRTQSLDGTWQIAEGRMDQAPSSFDRTVPVPGLASQAAPAFASPPGPPVADRRQVPQKDPARDAFWYRRTFTLGQPVPAVARLKVGKAMFGTKVILNGVDLGTHAPCFTPGYFDAAAALRPGENVLLVRVGADRDAVTAAVPSGFDFEKERYIPGIFDSVSLILSGTPHVLGAQVAPDLARGSARVRAVILNAGAACRRSISLVVREAASGREAGRMKSAELALAPGAEATLDLEVPIPGFRPWSPEDPFLYQLEVDTGSDALLTRFGMREFRFDPATKKALLNGKPYFMRGSNFTVYRFFEDGECRDRPWNREWVRLLHQRVKEMHWNCLRYCIGFPPEQWYDAADELGILIQDEFPVWFGGPGWSTYPRELKADELAAEYSEWMRERWNHPSVVIWDASNETTTDQTGPAVERVRDLDLSNRPWDNSYSPPGRPGDVFESHPYHFQDPKFTLPDIAAADPVPQGNAIRNDGGHAVVINEYGWLWLNRDGTPTTLTKELYGKLLGAGSTTEQRRHLYALYLAAETEFWRSHRNAAAVMHFTALGYSRPDGQTSDHWSDVGTLEWERQFHRYVRDAFAPVGLMLDFWMASAPAGTAARVRVALTNDLGQPWEGPVTLRLLRPGRAPWVAGTRDARIAPFGTAQAEFALTWPGEAGPATLEAELRGADGEPVRSVREFSIVP
jgi:beta-galactosidase